MKEKDQFRNLISGFIESVERFPLRQALVVDGKSFTYRMLGQIVSHIAATIGESEQRPNPLVAILAYRSLSALKNALLGAQSTDQGGVIKTLISEFDYPRRGPGMMWEATARSIEKNGGQVRLGAEVVKILWSGNKVEAVEVSTEGQTEVVEGTHFISSMPMRELIQRLEPAAPWGAVKGAMDLKYRDFLTVAVIVNRRDVLPDNWLYIHDDEAKVGRIQNFKNWSPEMVPDSNKTCLGLEYFCFVGDGLWTMSDQELIELAKKDLEKLGLVRASEVEDGTVVRMPKAYPIYDSTYAESVKSVRRFLNSLKNLQSVGRNGMHKYNNQDHSMLTAMLAVENILGANHNIWRVNSDQEYHEEVTEKAEGEKGQFAALASTQPRVPRQLPLNRGPKSSWERQRRRLRKVGTSG